MVIEKIFNFLIRFFTRIFHIKKDPEKEDRNESETKNATEAYKDIDCVKVTTENDNIKAIQLTLTKINILNQKIKIFEENFPDKYKSFKTRIEELKRKYDICLKASKEDLTYEIDPEKDGEYLAKILKLENEVESFIQKEVMFDIINKKLQKLIVKLNVLYNVSVVHIMDKEQQKVMEQVERARSLEFKIVDEIKSYEYLLKDMRIKDELIKLISYLDYEIYKLTIRNSNITPEEALRNLAIIVKFEKFDYNVNFKAFVEEDLAQINNLTEKVHEQEYQKVLKNDYNKIFTDITYSKEEMQILLDKNFWLNIFCLESNAFELLRESETKKEDIKIKVTSQLNISITEDDVLDLPKVNTYIFLLKIFSKTQDNRILLVMKLLKNISNEITYREIYFLLVLFEILDTVREHSDELFENIKKYVKKYNYESKTIKQKKEQVLCLNNNQYVYVFTLESSEHEMLEELKKLNMDFKNDNNKIFLNKIYFKALTNVVNSLEKATEKI